MSLQEYHRAIISAAWMVILSLIPQDLVRAGAVLLGFLICVHALRPRTLMETLQLRLSSLEEKLQDAVDSGIMRQSDTIFTNKFTRDIGRIRYMTFELYERTLVASGGILQEIKAICRGLSLEINECIRDVDRLERNLEINRAKILKSQYNSWKQDTLPSSAYEYYEIQNKRNWSIRIKTAVRALHLEMSTLNNVHENASALVNNIANQVAGDRNRCGRAKLEFTPRTVVIRKRQPLIRSDRLILFPDYQSLDAVGPQPQLKPSARNGLSSTGQPNVAVHHIHATSRDMVPRLSNKKALKHVARQLNHNVHWIGTAVYLGKDVGWEGD
ncbi:uncharacterized protein LACBIDRAFT_329648 [Laccaria bicolor S238N-H82]|uniref:Predicted protein n=1 Tax=Laccaria bicolor (strain S238N-H82 / ATCC MYA-4686) TaxID=486041 RepID=B0DIP8_LACBS|nr:uncharacterized protein LACBIDRAFT_329648 [Laccaria bicolor S238N-H82]EDR05607.1 predicted protein [Laccaria bicolor S238N-H82]|eukprot:XP_001883711.1 predicted protein [Laccaria bicolor S238N-H82]